MVTQSVIEAPGYVAVSSMLFKISVVVYMIFSGCLKWLEDDVSLNFISGCLKWNLVWKVCPCLDAFVMQLLDGGKHCLAV